MKAIALAIVFALCGALVTPADAKVACACGIRAIAE